MIMSIVVVLVPEVAVTVSVPVLLAAPVKVTEATPVFTDAAEAERLPSVLSLMENVTTVPSGAAAALESTTAIDKAADPPEDIFIALETVDDEVVPLAVRV